MCGELIHIFQRHDLKCYQALLILSVEKKQTENKENNLATGKYLTANPAIPSRSGIAVERELLCMQLVQNVLTYILCWFWLGYSSMG